MNSGFHLFIKNRGAVFGTIVLFAIVIGMLLGEIFYPVSVNDIVGAPMTAPMADVPLGTDYLGRDVLAGLIHGARTTLTIGLAGMMATVLFGVLLVGSFGGYFGGAIDAFLMRITEFFQVLPPMLLAMVLVSVFGASIWNVILVIGLVNWPPLARLTRAEFYKVKEADFVKAELTIGSTHFNIMSRVLLPNASPPLIVASALSVCTAILFESSLSFLGLSDPDIGSWGYMIGSSRDYVFEAWWSVIFPGAAIFVTVLSISLIGDGLNDALNPKLRTRS